MKLATHKLFQWLKTENFLHFAEKSHLSIIMLTHNRVITLRMVYNIHLKLCAKIKRNTMAFSQCLGVVKNHNLFCTSVNISGFGTLVLVVVSA